MIKKKTAKQSQSKEKLPLKYKLKAVGQILLLLSLGLVLVILVSDIMQLSGSKSESIDASTHLVRLQLVDSSGDSKAAADFVKAWENYSDEQIEIRVIESDDFDLHPVKNSFVVSRTPDTEAARLLAAHLGLVSENIDYQELENNYRQISVTLVLGSDCREIDRLFGIEPEKETLSKL